MFPRWVINTAMILVVAAMVPLACVARARVMKTGSPRVHIIQDMDDQPKYKAQQPNPLFADGRAMRAPLAGTVSQLPPEQLDRYAQLREDDHFNRGLDGDAYATEFPVAVTHELMERGQERYGIYCAPCHGLVGYGNGMVSRRALATEQGTWVPPASFHVEPASTRSVGHIFNTISNGIRNMPSYSAAIPVEDRWAIVVYVRALQRSQRAALGDVPSDKRGELGQP